MNNLKKKFHSLPKVIQIVFRSLVFVFAICLAIAAGIGMNFQIGRYFANIFIGIFIGIKLGDFYRYLDN